MAKIIFESSLSGGEPIVDMYENPSAGKAIRRISLNEWLHNGDSREVVEKARSMSLDVFRAKFVSELPHITPSGTLNQPLYQMWPPHPAVFAFNGFICVEAVCDGATSEDLECLKTDLSARFENLYYAGLSISGNGLMLILRMFSIGHYGLGYMSVGEDLQDHFGLTLDYSHLNFRHLLPPIYDPNPYFNPAATDDFRTSFRLGRWSNKGERSYEESERIT